MIIQLWKLWGHIISVSPVDLLLTTHPTVEVAQMAAIRHEASGMGSLSWSPIAKETEMDASLHRLLGVIRDSFTVTGLHGAS